MSKKTPPYPQLLQTALNEHLEQTGKSTCGEKRLLELIHEHPKLGVLKKPARKNALEEAIAAGLVIRADNRYGTPDSMRLKVGRIQTHAQGFAFFIPDEGDDLYIAPTHVNGAWQDDRVLVRSIATVRHSRSPERNEGEVYAILTRTHTKVVGVYDQGLVLPDDVRLPSLRVVEDKPELHNGDKVVAEVTDWLRPSATIADILGAQNAPGVDILAIMHQFGITETFDEPILLEADEVNVPLPKEELKRREDWRKQQIITIDGADAKDLDDAISLEIIPDGYRLGVHIADVSHYVQAGGLLDEEALRRGTSVYLSNRVAPMLPRQLSNGICSLLPNADRLTLSCIMDFDENGNIQNHRLCETVICSSERMTYEDVTLLLQSEEDCEDLPKQAELRARYESVLPLLQLCAELAEKRTVLRKERGAIDFDLPEPEFTFDETGRPVDVRRRPHLLAHRIIEEFMLAANETVAAQMTEQKIPFLYRVHDAPEPERLDAFRQFLAGYSLRYKGIKPGVNPKLLQQVLDDLRGTPQGPIVGFLLLRAMAKAVYHTEPRGHFGLAVADYCHFTSPIRRYPDLQIHRIIKEVLHSDGVLAVKRTQMYRKRLPDIGLHTSERERNAESAERAVDDLQRAQYMVGRIGERFEGTISGVTRFGFFVVLENTVEGLVRIGSLPGDFRFEEAHYAIVGTPKRGRSRTEALPVYRLGDRVLVEVVAVSVASRQIEFIPVGSLQREEAVLEEHVERPVKQTEKAKNTPRPTWAEKKGQSKGRVAKTNTSGRSRAAKGAARTGAKTGAKKSPKRK